MLVSDRSDVLANFSPTVEVHMHTGVRGSQVFKRLQGFMCMLSISYLQLSLIRPV